MSLIFVKVESQKWDLCCQDYLSIGRKNGEPIYPSRRTSISVTKEEVSPSIEPS